MAIRDSPDNEWFVQKLDHFDPSNSRTWNQRYHSSDMFFENREKGPIFLNLGGEAQEDDSFNIQELKVYARRYGALMLDLEHRFYGQSVPTEDFSTRNLRFLSSEQALADIAYFIEGMNEKYNLTAENKWVAFGGSYAGNLAAWVRLKYPHLVFAAVSSSAPVLAQVDFPGYFEIVGQVLAADSKKCAENVHRAALEAEKLLRDPHRADEATKKLNLCHKPKSKNDLTYAAFSLSTPFWYFVQFNYDQEVSFACKKMVDGVKPEDLLETYVNMSRYLLWNTGNCIPSNKYFIDFLKGITVDPDVDRSYRLWIYQTCAELGYFQTSSSEKAMFGSLMDLQYYLDRCEDVFGKSFNSSHINDNIRRTNMMYGGLGVVSSVSRVVFVQGSADPWHVLGINHSNNKDAPAIVIKGACHCADVDTDTSSPAVSEAQTKIEQLIGKWLGIEKE